MNRSSTEDYNKWVYEMLSSKELLKKKMSIVEFIFKCHAINVHKFNCFTDSDNLHFYACSSRILSNYHIIKGFCWLQEFYMKGMVVEKVNQLKLKLLMAKSFKMVMI